MIIKESSVLAYRVPTKRDVEDWRNDPGKTRQGAWAVHCLDHDQRTFFNTYSRAKDYAPLPLACPVCEAFDQRCTYCPSEVEQWLADRNTGYVPSVGHITGNAVCTHHQYGAIPEGIDYEEQQGLSAGKTIIAILAQEATNLRNEVVTVAFQPEERTYCVQCHFGSEYVTAEQAVVYSRALHFALAVTASLNAALMRQSSSTPKSVSFGYFEPWEQVTARTTQK